VHKKSWYQQNNGEGEGDIGQVMKRTSVHGLENVNPPMSTPQAPLKTITIQANYPLGPLPVSYTSNKYVLVVTDLFTKWVEAFPLKEASSATLSDANG